MYIMKRVLKPWVKVVLVIAVYSLFMILVINNLEEYNELGKQCDEVYGRTCKHHELEKFIKRGGEIKWIYKKLKD